MAATPVASAPVAAPAAALAEPTTIAAPVAVAAEAVAPVAAASAPAAVETASTSIATPAPAPVADLATLHAIVRSAGLQWIESDPVRVAQTLAEQPTVSVKLGRERKPAVVISSEPLVQVETRA